MIKIKNIFKSIIDFFTVNKLDAVPIKKGEVLFQTTNWSNKSNNETFFTDDLLLMQMKAKEISRKNKKFEKDESEENLLIANK